MPNITLLKCMLVFLLLNNYFINHFNCAKCKNLNTLCIQNTSLRKTVEAKRKEAKKNQIKKAELNKSDKVNVQYNPQQNIYSSDRSEDKYYLNKNKSEAQIIHFGNGLHERYENLPIANNNYNEIIISKYNTKNKENAEKGLYTNQINKRRHINGNPINFKILTSLYKWINSKKLHTHIQFKNSKLGRQSPHYMNIYNNYGLTKPKLLFINYLSTKYKNNGKNKYVKKYLRKYEELYEKYTPELDEQNDTDILSQNNREPMPNYSIDDFLIQNKNKDYKATLVYDYISNLHNNEYQNVESVNNFIKNNEVFDINEWKKNNKPYLIYKYKYKYKNPINKQIQFYEYEYYIPKLITYEEDISTEPKFVSPDLKSTKCYNNSPINFITTSGFSSRNIDTFGKERNKIYSFNTPTDVKRNIYFNDLIKISSSYNQHFFHNLNFLLNLYTLQILIRDKTAIETDYIIDKFDQLKDKLIQLNTPNSIKHNNNIELPLQKYEERNSNVSESFINPHSKTDQITPQNSDGHYEDVNSPQSRASFGDNIKSNGEISSDENYEKKENMKSEASDNCDNELDKEISRHLTHKKNLFDDKIQIFKNKYNENILEDTDFIKLWKYDQNGEIIEALNQVPVPKIYLNIDAPKYCLWKILQNSGKSAYSEIPTPNRKLEAWRQQVNLKSFYKQNFDTSISLRNISKEELSNFKMKIVEPENQSEKQHSDQSTQINYQDHGKDNHHEDDKNNPNLNNALNDKKVHQKNVESNILQTDKTSNVSTYEKGDTQYDVDGNSSDTESNNEQSKVNKLKEEHKKAFYTLVVRDGIIDEILSDDISILKKLNQDLKEKNESNEGKSDDSNATEQRGNEQVGPNGEKRTTSKIFVGSFFNIKDPEVEYLINKELYFIPEHTNWYKTNTQPFVRGQIGKQSRKFDNDYPIYDYRKSDFGMAKFSALNLASIKDCAVLYLDKDIDLSDKYFHIIFISTSKSEDENLQNGQSYVVYENVPTDKQSSDTEKKQASDEAYNEDEDHETGDDLLPNDQTNNSNVNINHQADKESGSNPITDDTQKNNPYKKNEIPNSKHNPITNPRLVLYIKENSKINIHESHISLNDNNGGMVNAFSRIYLEQNSKVNHILSQELGKNVWYFHNVSVQNGINANYKFVDILLGSLSSRVNLQIEGNQGCKQQSYGLSLLEGKQNISQYEMFHHEHPSMQTDQLFKSLVSDTAHSVWRSRGRIERNAIKAKLNTLCRSVLLNLGASAVAIPTLEIIPSDIEEANHGATISDLEQEPIFSLMSRGIDTKIARQIMMKAFVNEILEHIPDENLKNKVYQKIFKFSQKYKDESKKILHMTKS
ncbi:FeS cluster assembly protein SufD, putative [Plasmodium chabaudi chabaudi]|uniref:FeS cluster assembly protein SufD, putative n=1 Tax=Plasmodium chabaudi chabaudi TaxID=31271 RepID=A0A4V0K7A0_PLACU|nr:FeS cluster assembly protein SufD, putative [Plasmodium chabaudi chabaudi]VTZ68616.1 FeS cluster assembly protein SufD, putative [Plasmodium chabaudi chabaudi]|eukprot:XP_745982.1 FeS cluster assembly protein SufD, putative [Plasmodium chabaudi chabaudi]